MICPIIHDRSLLSLSALPADENDRELAANLLDTLMAHTDSCVGMAANMIGVNKAIIAVRDEDQFLVMLNPVILRKSIPYEAEEGCLSLPGTRKTTRYKSIRVAWQDTRMQTQHGTFLGFTAQIIQHEIDHLSGILI